MVEAAKAMRAKIINIYMSIPTMFLAKVKYLWKKFSNWITMQRARARVKGRKFLATIQALAPLFEIPFISLCLAVVFYALGQRPFWFSLITGFAGYFLWEQILAQLLMISKNLGGSKR